MNIAIVNATYNWGGVKTWMLDFAEQLALRGHTVRVYGRQEAFILAARQRVGHGQCVDFGPDCNPLTVGKFMQRFKTEKIDVVFINIGKDLATAGLAARFLQIPVVQFIGLPQDIPYKFKTSLLHRFVRPYFLSSCRFIEAGFLKSLPYLGAHESKVILTAKKAGTHVLEAHNPRRLVVTQQLHTDKGHETLLRALARVTRPFVLHVAGVGPLREPLEELALSLNINQHIVWHGFVDNVPALLRDKDIFLLGSFSEGLPNTLQEALAEGLLPVIRNVGGVCEVMPPSLEPWILPYEADETAFARVLDMALALPDDELLALREDARTACRERFDLTTNAEVMEHWLTSLVKE